MSLPEREATGLPSERLAHSPAEAQALIASSSLSLGIPRDSAKA